MKSVKDENNSILRDVVFFVNKMHIQINNIVNIGIINIKVTFLILQLNKKLRLKLFMLILQLQIILMKM